MEVFYNYVYLDPRKPGKYCYNNYCFLYQPFYIGKGKNNRYLDHINYDKRNTLKNNVIEKIKNSGFNLKNYIIILEKNLSELDAFINEISLITEIGIRYKNDGPLCNCNYGGKGGDTISFNPNRDKIIEKFRRSGVEHWAYGKKYDEIYGKNAIIQKEKRSKSLIGYKFSEERREKISESLKGNVPWNKGLTSNDPRVKKNCRSGKPHKSKYYKIINSKNDQIYEFSSKTQMEIFFLEYNKNIERCRRIDVDYLIANLSYKNFSIIQKGDKLCLK